MTTYKTREIVASLTLKLNRITETVDESGQYAAEYHSMSRQRNCSYSTLESRCSGFAFNTTKIRIGKNESAFSSLLRCLSRPIKNGR